MKFLFSILAISLCIACGKATDEDKKGSGGGGQFGPLSTNTCHISNPDGKLPDGTDHQVLSLYPEYIGVYDQSLHIRGKFPSNYTIHRKYETPSRPDLLKKAKNWKWVLGPGKDEFGNYKDLAIWKEIMYTNGEVYVVDLQNIDYGSWDYLDEDAPLLIECNIPAN